MKQTIDLIAKRQRAMNRVIEFYSTRVSLYSHETCACRMLFALMETLARKEKRKQEQEMRYMRYAYELRARESVGIRSIS